MSLPVSRSDWFVGDLEHYAAWYQHEASWDVAERYLRAVSATVSRLAETPGLGRPTRFSNPVLRGLRCFPAERPFNKHLIFYRSDESELHLVRVVHGARNLSQSLTQPPSS